MQGGLAQFVSYLYICASVEKECDHFRVWAKSGRAMEWRCANVVYRSNICASVEEERNHTDVRIMANCLM